MLRAISNTLKVSLMLLGVLMILNVALYATVPKYTVPVYKMANSLLHDSKVKSEKDIHEIFDNIKDLLPMEYGRQLKLNILKSSQVNAWVRSDGNVTMTTAMINALQKDKGAIAAVLGHEVSHYILSHHALAELYVNVRFGQIRIHSRVPDSVWTELMADNLGIFLGKSAGYNACNGAQFWGNLMLHGGNNLYPGSHPIRAYRLWNINNLCKEII